MEELVTVIMSTYNEKINFLEESVESVLSQNYERFEFLIVADNPFNKELEKLLSGYEKRDSRIRIIYNDINIGLPRSLNRAIKEAKGKYIMRMDADDISMPGRMRKQVDYLENHSEIDMVCGNRIEIDEESDTISYPIMNRIDEKKIKRLLPYGNPIVHPTVMVKKSVFDKLGGYRNIKGGEDYDLWLRMLTSNFRIEFLGNEPIIKYRIRNDSITRSDYIGIFFSGEYSRMLYRERKKHCKDTYSKNNMEKYEKILRSNPRRCSAINSLFSVVGTGEKQVSFSRKILIVLKAAVVCPSVFPYLKSIIVYKLLLKL